MAKTQNRKYSKEYYFLRRYWSNKSSLNSSQITLIVREVTDSAQKDTIHYFPQNEFICYFSTFLWTVSWKF